MNRKRVLPVAVLNDRWRVVDDPVQWLLQRRERTASEKSSGWAGEHFCRQRRSLLRDIRENCGEVDPAALAVIEALPDRHPDRDTKKNPAATLGDCRALNHSWRSDSLTKPQRTQYEKITT